MKLTTILSKEIIGFTIADCTIIIFCVLIGLFIGLILQVESYESIVEAKCNLYIQEHYKTNESPNYDDYYIDYDLREVVINATSTGGKFK